MRKKTIAVLLIIAIAAICVVPVTVAFAENESSTDYSPYDVYKEFCSYYPDRTVGTQNEINAAYYIMKKLQSYGLVAVNGSASGASVSDNAYLQSFSDTYQIYDAAIDDYTTVNVASVNVVAYKRTTKENAKLLVIGCGYGNVYGLTTDGASQIKTEAAYENSSAVATVLDVAKQLKKANELDFDVAFAFFGADAYDCMGAKAFVKNNTQELLGYINLTAVSGGDYLYAYYDDIKTAHGKLFDDVIDRYSLDVKRAPFDKKTYSVTTENDNDRPYWHIGLNSSNFVFMDEGVPSVNLFGYNWSKSEESTTHADIIRTSNDTFEYMDKYYGKDKINERMVTARTVVVNGVLKNGELVTAFEKYDAGYTKLYSSGVYYGVLFSCIGLAIVLFIVGVVFATKITRKAGKPDFSTNSAFFNGSSSNTGSEDIFGMGDDGVVEGDSNDIDTDDKKTSDSTDSSEKGDDDDDIFGEF